MKISTFFKKFYWPAFLTVQQTVILFFLKDGLDRQYLTTDSIHLVIGFFMGTSKNSTLITKEKINCMCLI
ncbi:hypothetical protein [Streptococcus mitis]|uniref:hypothetical protein n=1 Tax=Streptococcus mitis TaxID=28037 RepID=UPI001CBDEB70|nr:hypothetical protein [Streptococcus mitis]